MREAFFNFEPLRLGGLTEYWVEEQMQNPAIIRNRLKLRSVIKNANAYFRLCEKHGSLNEFFWSHVGNKPILNHYHSMEEVPARTELSDTLSKELKKLGFSFIGSTIIYAFMQSVGMVNDHLTTCFLHPAWGKGV